MKLKERAAKKRVQMQVPVKALWKSEKSSSGHWIEQQRGERNLIWLDIYQG